LHKAPFKYAVVPTRENLHGLKKQRARSLDQCHYVVSFLG
jgi:hypothetical protein